jgi:hypothetical protein
MVAMVEQKFDPALDRDPNLKRLVETASDFLEDETKETADPAVATWSLVHDHSHDLVNLNIHDPNLNVFAFRNFSLAELKDFDELEKDIIRLWGKVLARRSAVRLERLMKSLREEGEGK